MDTRSDQLAEAQRRLQLVLRSQHGPTAPAVWAQACTSAGVVCTGALGLDELDRVTAHLVEQGGACAVAARSCRVRLLFLRRTAGSSAAPAVPGRLDDASVREALAEPDALDEQAWLQRLAELEASVTPG